MLEADAKERSAIYSGGRANGSVVSAGALEARRSVDPLVALSPATEMPAATPPAVKPGNPGVPANGGLRRRLRLVLMAAGIVAVTIGAVVFWLRGGRYAGTDDAYVQSPVVVVTTDVSGLVSSVSVREGQQVSKGDLLFQLELNAFQIALDNATSRLATASLNVQSLKDDYQVMLSNVAAQEAQVALDQVTFERASALVKQDFVSRANYDQARYTLELDKQKLESLRNQALSQLARLDGNAAIDVADHPLYREARAAVDEAQRELDHASVRAPFDGIVTQVDSLQPGDYLVAQTAALTGAGAMALVATDHMWVDAEMKETDLTYVKPGDPVTVTIDTYPGQVWSGTVDSISPASGSEFSILPAENSSGNFVKVVQRIPVRISIDTPPGTPVLRAGMSAVISIDTGHSRSFSDLF